MCGIAGIYGSKDKNLVKSMCDAISHRGPDGEGFFEGQNGVIGSRRLAIIDVSGGQMPISNEDGSIWIAYNGEIYNHQILSQELKKIGYKYKTHSDTETVLHAYQEWGFDCVKKFNGMFAFAIYDTKKDIIFAARDQFGIKPFYYQ
jgi:asparagine synthase (glutamine-hydrolysing)